MNILQLILFNLKVNRNQIIAWSIAMFGAMFLYMILFSSIQDIAQIKIESLPQELMQFVGMDNLSDLSNYVNYFATIFNLILVAISIFACIFAANLLHNEEKHKTIEFLYAMPVSRLEIYVAKLITAYIAVMLLLMATSLSAILCGYISGGETFNLWDMINIIKTSSIIPFIFLSIGLMISAISGKVSGAALTSALVALAYVLGFISSLVGESLSWIKYFSPFEVFSPTHQLMLDGDTLLLMTGYGLIVILFILVGGIYYRRRDFIL